MSSVFQTVSGTLCAQEGVAEEGRENPAMACLIAAASSRRRERVCVSGETVGIEVHLSLLLRMVGLLR